MEHSLLIKNKADMAAYTGSTVVDNHLVDDVLKELENNYSGLYYGDITMNGLTIIEKVNN